MYVCLVDIYRAFRGQVMFKVMLKMVLFSWSLYFGVEIRYGVGGRF